jgi:hypothetical protein
MRVYLRSTRVVDVDDEVEGYYQNMGDYGVIWVRPELNAEDSSRVMRHEFIHALQNTTSNANNSDYLRSHPWQCLIWACTTGLSYIGTTKQRFIDTLAKETEACKYQLSNKSPRLEYLIDKFIFDTWIEIHETDLRTVRNELTA